MGGWGGRYELYRPEVPVTEPRTFIGGVAIPPETRPIWTNAVDEYTPPVAAEYGRAIRRGEKSFRGNAVTLWGWRDDFQNDFAARIDWTIKSYQEANHPPVPVLDHPEVFTVRSGEAFAISAQGSTDPDGDSLSYFWFGYPEAGTYKTSVKIEGAENMDRVSVVAPKIDKPQTIHLILRVTDKGSPPLSRYKRVIVAVVP